MVWGELSGIAMKNSDLPIFWKAEKKLRRNKRIASFLGSEEGGGDTL